MIDTDTVGAPGWYLKRLDTKLRARRREVAPLFDRYNGNAPLPVSLRDAPETARRFFKVSRTTFAEMLVKSVKYPLKVQSVLTAADRADTGDREAWRMFIRSGMAGEVDDVHRLSLLSGNGYAIVSQYEGEPRYTAEDPRQVVTIHDPVVQARIVAAGKFFHHDEDGTDYAYLYRPGRVWRAMPDSTRRRPASSQVTFSGRSWSWDPEYGGEEGRPLPVPNLMPVLRYRNEEGVGEFQRHLDILDRIDHMVLQGMTIATLQAFKQRAIKVNPEDMPDEDEDGNPIDYSETFLADPGALWKLPATADIWESGAVDLTPIWTGTDKAIQQLSAVTFTPLAMFSSEGQNQSAEGARFTREGRTFKMEDRQDRFGLTHAHALSMLFQIAGDEQRSPLEDIEVLWRPAQRHSLTEKAAAGAQAKAADVPWRTRMIEVWQFTPAQVRRMEAERMDDLLMVNELADVTAADEATRPPSPPAEPAA